jgi:molybdate transport system substrate-binding protein
VKNRIAGANRIVAVALGLVLTLAQASAAQAPGNNVIKVLCSTALRTVMQELVPQFERATGNKVVIEYGVSAAMQRRVEAGEPFDAIFLTVKQLDALVQEGKIAPGTRTPVARSGMAIAIHAGAARPDIKTMDALKRTLLAAKSIAYAKEGASGLYFIALAKRLGIVDQLKLKGTDTGDEVGEAVASGAAELGILPVSEILPVKGVELLGEFPKEVQEYAVSVGGVSAAAKQATVAKDLIKFLTAPAAAPVIRKKGMEPER